MDRGASSLDQYRSAFKLIEKINIRRMWLDSRRFDVRTLSFDEEENAHLCKIHT